MIMKEEYNTLLNRNKIRRINTLYSPEGCHRINGKWDKKHHICILSETETPRIAQAHGWTAPVHGAFVWWHVGPYAGTDEEYGGEIGVYSVDKCDLYPEMPCTDPYGEYYQKINYDDELLIDFYKGIKEQALEIASDIARGHAYDHDMIYYNEQGETSITPQSKNDKVSYPPCPGCMRVPTSYNKPKGFRIRRQKK